MKYSFCILLILPFVVSSHQPALNMKWIARAPLPFPRSDMTATAVETDTSSEIFVIGGCSKDQIWLADAGMYICPEITNKCTVFTPADNQHAVCEPAPRARYRHAAALVNGSVWLVGGRDINDAIVQEVDVYNVKTKQWSTPLTLAEATSDLAAFESNGVLFMLGGYEADYTASDKMWKLNTNSAVLVPQASTPLLEGRGDIHAAHTDSNTVFVSGGFTHEDGFCSPHASVEQYKINQGEWTKVASLSSGRGDKSLVGLEGRLFAIAGESKVNCSQTVPVDVVEVYDPLHDEWVAETKLESPTFRFVGAAAERFSSLYIFGGQKYLNKSCNCYPVESEVWSYVHDILVAESYGYSAAAVNTVETTTTLISLVLLFVFN